MWITKFRFSRIREYEITRAKLVNVVDPRMTATFGDRGEIEIIHRSSADASTAATREAIQSLEKLFLELEILCEPRSLHTYNAAASEPIPELLGLAEVAQILGISRSRASQLAKSGGLPPPVARPKMGPIFDAQVIAAVAAQCPRCTSECRTATAGSGRLANVVVSCAVCHAVADAEQQLVNQVKDAVLPDERIQRQTRQSAAHPATAIHGTVGKSKQDRVGSPAPTA